MKFKINRLFRVIVLVVLGGVIGLTSIQASVSLQTKIGYMEKLKKEAADLEERGYYDDSIKKSLEVQHLAEEIDIIVDVLKKWYLLQRNIAVAKQVGADRFATENFNKAVDFYKAAEQAFIDDDIRKAESNIEEGLYYIELAIEIAKEEFDKINANSQDRLESTHNIELEKVDGEYEVRLIPNRRDSLWRIAEYDFIYGNPWIWRRIYNANKSIINDPDLIYPGQKLIIPALPYELELEN